MGVFSSFRAVFRRTCFGRIRAAAIVALVTPLLAAPVLAEQGSTGNAGEGPTTIKLVLHPAPEPRPALKYRLLAGFMDLRPGNAAVMYNKLALQVCAADRDGKEMARVCKWLDVPLAELDRKEAREALSRFRDVLKGLELAARYERCDWQLPLREEDPFALLLPELQQARAMARLLVVQTELQTAEGKLDEAICTLQTGYALGRHIGAGRTLVNGLVGIAICANMSDQVEQLVQQRGAPNLYWALTWLPRPVVDMRPGFEAEMHMLDFAFPELQHVEETGRSPEYWRRLLDRLTLKVVTTWGGREPTWRDRLEATALALKGYPMARDGLVQQGCTPGQVEAMPVPQVVLVYSVRTYRELRDQIFKRFALPYPEARLGMERAEKEIAAEGAEREIVPVAQLLLPALGAVNRAVGRSQRRIAVLRAIEALRMYAARHDGRLPEKLDDVTEVPVPPDPMTGRPFVYRRKGERTAVLEAPLPEGLTQPVYWLRYEITMEK